MKRRGAGFPGRVQRARNKDERGSSSLQLVILFPVVLLLIFTAVQGALYYHARNVALSAAQEGVRAAKAENGSNNQGRQAARAFVTQAGGEDVMTGVNVTSNRGANEATVTVTGRPISVIPGVLNFRVSQTAQGPIEVFTAPQGP